MGVIEKAVAWAIDTANDNSHGYSQADRWGPDYDCSSFVISAYEQAGLSLREAGASYTGNMRGAFLRGGFVDVTTQVGLTSGYGIQPGDVLLNYSAHTCIAVGGGKVANCRTSEGHPQAGDQSGNEIRIQSYWNFPWNCVLRYKGNNQSTEKQWQNDGNFAALTENHDWKPQQLQYSNSYKADCVVLQALLNAHHFPCGSADGFFGAKTQNAVFKCQEYYKIEKDGICGKQTWKHLLQMN